MTNKRTACLSLSALLMASGLATSSCSLAEPAAPATHPIGPSLFVDCSQASDGNGSIDAPFNRLADLDQPLVAGTQILFKRGVTCHGQFLSQGSGTAKAPIRVAAYGSGNARPVIAADGVSGAGAAGAAVALHNQEYWEIHDLEVTNTGTDAAERNGILVELDGFTNGTDADGNPIGVGHHYLIDRVYVHDVNGDDVQAKHSNGIQLRVSGTTVPDRFDDAVVQDSIIEKVDREGLTTASSQSCRVEYGCTGTQNWNPSTRVVFQRNTLRDIGGDGIVIRVTSHAKVHANLGAYLAQRSHHANAGFWTINADDTDFSYNEVHHTAKNAYNNDGTAFDSDYGNKRPVFRHNYSHDNQGGFMLLCGGCGGAAYTLDTSIRYNLSVNDGRGIVVNDGSGVFDADGTIRGGAAFVNNTIYLPAGSTTAITTTHIAAYQTGIAFINNIFYNLGTGGFQTASTTYRPAWANNLFYGATQDGAPTDASELFADPALVGPFTDGQGLYPTGFAGVGAVDPRRQAVVLDGFKLNHGSPAQHRGRPLYGEERSDIFGNRLPSYAPPDIGVHQLSAVHDAAP